MADNVFYILHLSDTHSVDKVEQLKDWLKKRNQRVDLILMSGDLANMPVDYDPPQEELDKYTKEMEKMIRSIVNIQSNMYYIPGNHDPITSFAKETCLVPPTTPPPLPYNVDKKLVYIAPSLCLAGFGGSLPALSSSTGEKVWDGFPYKTEKEYNHAVKDLTDGLFNQESVLQPNDLLIFMTHVGPTESGTTFETKDVKSPIITGSDKLLHSLKTPKAQKHCILNVHGHTHVCSGRTYVGKVSVTNSGSIMEGGNFAIYEFQKNPWRVSTMSYHTLE